MKCKNVECLNETTGKRVYCSLTCRNYYVNKYVRDYSKMHITLDKQVEERKLTYYNDPKKCPKCDSILEYDDRFNTFCSRSCSAAIVNISRSMDVETKSKISMSLRHDTIRNCAFCEIILPYRRVKNKYCSDICRKNKQRQAFNAFKIYRCDAKFKFALNKYPNEFDFSLIKEHGWYKAKNHGNNLDGVSRDHMYSIKEGYKSKVDPRLIAHPANCKLMRHTKNFQKWTTCSITLDELYNRIKNWDLKYGYFYGTSILD